MTALDSVAHTRGGRLGFNVKCFIETGEEIGSIGLHPFLKAQKERLAADVFIGLDGPRQTLDRPEIKLGCRGGIAFDLVVKLREGSTHYGPWGGALGDTGFILGPAVAATVSPQGRRLVSGWRPAA